MRPMLDDPDKPRRNVLRARAQVSQLIQDHMDRHGMRSMQEFADRYKIGRSTLYELVRGRTQARGAWVRPRFDTLIALSEALDVPLHELVYLFEPDARGASEVRDYAKEFPARKVPVEIAGWAGAGPDQFIAALEPPLFVDLAYARGRALRAFRVQGDSMAAGRRPIYNGDLVLVNTNDPGHNTDAVVARLVHDAYVCKMLKDDRFGRMLVSANPTHTNGTPTAIPMEDVAEVVGKVVRIISEVDRDQTP